MEITCRQSMFSQFSKDLWLVAKHEGAKIDFDVDQKDLLSFAGSLIDLAIDCIRHSDKETDDIDRALCDAFNEIVKIDNKK